MVAGKRPIGIRDSRKRPSPLVLRLIPERHIKSRIKYFRSYTRFGIVRSIAGYRYVARPVLTKTIEMDTDG